MGPRKHGPWVAWLKCNMKIMLADILIKVMVNYRNLRNTAAVKITISIKIYWEKTIQLFSPLEWNNSSSNLSLSIPPFLLVSITHVPFDLDFTYLCINKVIHRPSLFQFKMCFFKMIRHTYLSTKLDVLSTNSAGIKCFQ